MKKAKRLPTRKAIKVGCKIQEAIEEGFAAGCERYKREGAMLDVDPSLKKFEEALRGTAIVEDDTDHKGT